MTRQTIPGTARGVPGSAANLRPSDYTQAHLNRRCSAGLQACLPGPHPADLTAFAKASAVRHSFSDGGRSALPERAYVDSSESRD